MKISKNEKIIILHGWGLFGDRYKELKENFENKGFQTFSPDLPGFGKNIVKTETLTLDDYAIFLKKIILDKQLDNVILLGHSFGGRVIVKLLDKYGSDKIRAIILTGTPLISEKLTHKKKFVNKLSKFISKKFEKKHDNFFYIFLRRITYKMIGEWDYYKAGKIKNTFLNIINEKLDEKLNKIKIPTLIIWGRNDKITPLSIAKGINKEIKESELIILDGTHKLPYENPEQFSAETIHFINKL